jgi:DNA-binding transcriptional MerR regulator
MRIMDTTTGLLALHVRAGDPDFLDLPWTLPLAKWRGATPRLVDVSRGVGRHEVVFVSYRQGIYALKELPPHVAQREYERLGVLEERGLPAVRRVGVARVRQDGDEVPDEGGVLVTRFLDASLPYRALFRQSGLARYRERLLDAMASLLVRLHLAGFYWGDCSLSNTLFRRDAGELQAYLVDAETSEVHDELSEGQREMDLGIMEENVTGELADVAAEMKLPRPLDVASTGVDIRRRYERLWDEITREVTIGPGERFRIHERIRALNDLGFSVSEVELVADGEANHLRMRAIVTDRDYHRHQLHSLTGVAASERQANLMLQEIREVQATLARERPSSVPLSTAAHEWLEQRWQPASERLAALVSPSHDLPERYCQVLEHKWFMSERAGRDVGIETALEDYLARARKGRAELPPAE